MIRDQLLSGQQSPLKVAVTGGIGSGKSFVVHLLAEKGIKVYDCDAAAKRLMNTSKRLRRQLCHLIGPQAYVDGKLNKAAVAQFIMSSEENHQRVNDVVHPAVGDDFIRSGLSWMECAILFESGFQRYVDLVACVSAPIDLRLERIMQRDGISREKALEWMGKQLPQEVVIAQSDFEIVNDGRDLHPQINQLLTLLTSYSTNKQFIK